MEVAGLNRYCGVDWAEGHHDIAIADTDGKLLAKRRIADNPTGFAELTSDTGRRR